MTPEMHQLESALAFAEEEAQGLSRLLQLAREQGEVSYLQVASVLAEPEEALLAAWHWRMLIPTGCAARTMAWEDAVLTFAPQARYTMPRIVRLTVEQAVFTGFWEPHQVLGEACPILQGRPAKTAAELLRQMGFAAQDMIFSARTLGNIMKQLRIRGSLDQLIIELKAVGVISPYLSSTMGIFRGTSPRYEINPCLLRGIV